MAKKLGFADLMFKNIKVEGDRPVPEDVLREMNRGSWSTGYTGQSPERLKAHMRNQHKFDLVTLRAPKDDPEVGGDFYGLPWPCWGTPELRHPGSPILYNADAAVMDGGNGFRARFGVERNGQTLLAEGSYLPGSEIKDGYPEFTMGVFKKLGWDKDLTPAELATIEKVAGSPGNIDTVSWSTDLSGGIQRVAMKHGCSPYGNGKARTVAWNLPDPIPVHREPIYSPRVDLVRTISDVARREAVQAAEYRLLGTEDGCRQRHCQGVPADRFVGSPCRIRRRRRRDPLQQVARRAAAGHVHRDQSGGRRRARHQGWRLGLGHGSREQRQGEDESAGHRARRQGRDLDALPFWRLVRRRGSAVQVSAGHRSDRARRKRQHAS